MVWDKSSFKKEIADKKENTRATESRNRDKQNHHLFIQLAGRFH
jgi:hypothetical protein